MRSRYLPPLVAIIICAIMIGFNAARAYSFADDPAPPQEPENPNVAITPLLQYQGRMTNPTTGQPVADGTYAVTFSLYDVASGGTAKWAETKNVPVAGGLFSTALGDTTPLPQALFSGQALWLGIKVGSDLEATPRQAIVPVAYALSLVPGAAITGSLTSPALRVSNTGGPALVTSGATTLGGNVTINGTLSGGTHAHSGADITSGSVAGTYIDAAIARDSEIMPTVLANDGAGSGLDADRLDGLHASSFAGASHTHSGTQYLTIGSEGFVPGSNVDYFNTYGIGGAYIVSGNGGLVAPVHLPHGAVVTEFRVYYYDNSTGDLNVYLYGQGFSTSYFQLASVTSSGTPSYGNGVDTTIANATINNTSSSYMVDAYSNAWDSELRIKAVVIQYTVSSVP